MIDDPVSYWPMNEISGSGIKDVASGNDGTATGTTVGQIGKIGLCRKFNSTSDVIDCSDSALADGSSALTVSIWAFQDALALNSALITKWDYQTQGSWAIQTGFSSNTQLQFFIPPTLVDDGSNGRGTTPLGSWTSGVWHHVVGVFDGTLTGDANRMKVYIDTVQQTLTFFLGSVPATMNDSTAHVRIGNWGGTLNNRGWNGGLDDARIYNRPLSQQEVNQLYTFGYNNQLNQKIRPRPFAPGLAR